MDIQQTGPSRNEHEIIGKELPRGEYKLFAAVFVAARAPPVQKSELREGDVN
jgi:hypothetical protein